MYNEITDLVTKALKENKDYIERKWYVSLCVDNNRYVATADIYIDSEGPTYKDEYLYGTDNTYIAEIPITKEQHAYIVENIESLIWQIN